MPKKAQEEEGISDDVLRSCTGTDGEQREWQIRLTKRMAPGSKHIQAQI